MSATEAAYLARIILDDSEADRPNDLYTLNVHEARTLANAVARVDELADRLDAEAKREGPHGVMFVSHAFATEIRNALEGETA